HILWRQGIDRVGARLVARRDAGQAGRAPAVGVGLLPFRRVRPALPEHGGVGMGGVLQDGGAVHDADALGQHVVHGSALLDAAGVVVGVAGETGGRLPGDEQLGQIGVPLVEFDVVRGDALDEVGGLFVAMVLPRGEAHQQLRVARLGDQAILPLRVGEVLELARDLVGLDEVGVPGGDDVDHVGGDPVLAAQALGIGVGLGGHALEEDALLVELLHVVGRTIEDVGERAAAAPLGHDAGRERIAGCVDVVHLDAREALLEGGQDHLSVDLRQRSVEGEWRASAFAFSYSSSSGMVRAAASASLAAPGAALAAEPRAGAGSPAAGAAGRVAPAQATSSAVAVIKIPKALCFIALSSLLPAGGLGGPPGTARSALIQPRTGRAV